MVTYKTNGHDYQRRSSKMVYTYAVIFTNQYNSQGDTVTDAAFHINLKNAQRDFKVMESRKHLTPITIVAVSKVGK
jgi:hypothetical protein